MSIDMRLGEHAILLGKTGSGKTMFFRKQWLSQLRRCMVVDTEERQFGDMKLLRRRDGKAAARCVPRDRNKGFHWRVVPPTERDARINYLEELCEGLMDHFKGEDLGSMMLYIDEGTDFCDAHRIDEWFEAAFRKFRKREISLTLSVQRPQGLNKWAENNSTHRLVFFVEPFDRKYLDELWPGLGEQIAVIPYRRYPEDWTDPSRGYTDKTCFLYIDPGGEVTPYLQP
jgi:hypothetical protein